MSELLHLIAVILSVPVVIVLAALCTLGGYLVYCSYRIGRHPLVDRTAALLNFMKLIWLMVSQIGEFAKRNEFIQQDLSEQLGYPQDKKIT